MLSDKEKNVQRVFSELSTCFHVSRSWTCNLSVFTERSDRSIAVLRHLSIISAGNKLTEAWFQFTVEGTLRYGTALSKYFQKQKANSGGALEWGFAPLFIFRWSPTPSMVEVSRFYGILEIIFFLHQSNNGKKQQVCFLLSQNTAVLFLYCYRQLTGNLHPSCDALRLTFANHSYPCITTLGPLSKYDPFTTRCFVVVQFFSKNVVLLFQW